MFKNLGFNFFNLLIFKNLTIATPSPSIQKKRPSYHSTTASLSFCSGKRRGDPLRGKMPLKSLSMNRLEIQSVECQSCRFLEAKRS